MADRSARVAAVKVENMNQLYAKDAPPGAVLVLYRGEGAERHPSAYFHRCPGCRTVGAIRFDGEDDGHRWSVAAGNVEEPATVTLTPSIHHVGEGCGWHGYLRSGVFEPC